MLPLTVYLSLFEKCPLCECLVSASDDPIILAVNEAWAAQLGRPPADLVGRRLLSPYPDSPSQEGNGSQTPLHQALATVLTTHQTVSQIVSHPSVRPPQGAPIDNSTQHACRLTDMPIFDEEGDILCIMHRAEEVSRSQCVDAAPLRSAEYQRLLLRLADRLRPLGSADEVITAATEMLGQTLAVARVSYAEIDDVQGTFFVRSHWLATGCASIAGETRRLDDFGPQIIELLRGGSPMVVHDVAHDPRTQPYASAYAQIGVRANLAIPLVKAGRLTTVLSMQHDAPRQWRREEIELAIEVAERTWAAAETARAQQQLQQANQRKDEFLAMLAHELRNPLAPIRMAAELLMQPQVSTAMLHKTHDVIARQVTHMTGLVDDLLDVSRVNRGLVTIDESPQDMHAIVATALEQARPLIEAQRHHLELDLTSEPMTVSGDAKRLVQIITNLVNNAAKYTPPGGRLRLALEGSEQEVRLRVSDNGLGISKALQPHIFELFVQAQRTPDRRQGGLGIGLALVRSLVALHRGTVTVFSEGAGQGSCFTVTLPRLVIPPAGQSPEDTVQA